MAVQSVATAASQLINTSTNLAVPLVIPAVMGPSSFSVNVWINANWGTIAAPRGRKSFVGIYGPMARTSGWCAMYFNNMTLTDPAVLVRNEKTINMASTPLSPGPGVNATAWSARWIGFFTPPTTSTGYYFQTNSDDGVRVYVNSVLVINNFTDHSAATNNSAAISLTAGVEVPIVVEFYQNGGDAVISLSYTTTNMLGTPTNLVIVPATTMNTSKVVAQTMTALQIGTGLGAGEVTCWTYGGTQMVSTAGNFMQSMNNQWVNVCYTYETGLHRLYVNGVLAVTDTTEQFSGTLKYITINGFYAGGASETDNHYVDSYLLYNRALSADEIQTIYHADGGRHGIWNGLMANYEFDEASDGVNATTIYDLTGGGANLLMTGAGTPPKYSYTNSHADSNVRPPVSY